MDFNHAQGYFGSKGILIVKPFTMCNRSDALLKSKTKIIPQSCLRPDQMATLLRATV